MTFISYGKDILDRFFDNFNDIFFLVYKFNIFIFFEFISHFEEDYYIETLNIMCNAWSNTEQYLLSSMFSLCEQSTHMFIKNCMSIKRLRKANKEKLHSTSNYT